MQYSENFVHAAESWLNWQDHQWMVWDLRFHRNMGIFSCCHDFMIGRGLFFLFFSFDGERIVFRFLWGFVFVFGSCVLLFVWLVGFFFLLLNGDVLVLRQVIVFGLKTFLVL